MPAQPDATLPPGGTQPTDRSQPPGSTRPALSSRRRILRLRRRIRRIPMRMRGRLVDYLVGLGFPNMRRCMVHGPRDRLHLGKGVGCTNNVFYNTRSGHIYIGDNSVLSFNCMLLTGRHEFENGQLKQPRKLQVPDSGYDIRVGQGCWIASGAIILGGVTIGDNCLVAAGAIVTKDVPAGSIVGGVPAKVIGEVRMLGQDAAPVAPDRQAS